MEGATNTMQTAFQTALNTVQTDVMAYVEIALPVGLAIMGLFLAIRLGIRFFRSVAN
mgnify:CR=1 FL=1